MPASILYAMKRMIFRVMELELIEPSLYLRTHTKAPDRFAGAIDQKAKDG